MSSRHIRRLKAIKDKTQNGNEEESDDHDDGAYALPNTTFQGLEVSSDSESENRTLGDPSPSTSAIAGPSSSLLQYRSANIPEEDKYGAKKKTYTQAELDKKEKMARRKSKRNKQLEAELDKKEKMARRKSKINKQLAAQKEDEEMNWLSEQMRLSLDIQPQEAEEMVVDKKEQRKRQLFYINPHHLDVNKELAKVYGNKDKYEYEFHRGTSAAETARRINDVYGGGVAKENTVRFLFRRFRIGNFDLQNKPRETKVDNVELKAIVEADPSETSSELAAGGGVSDKTVLIYLKQIGKLKKLERKILTPLNRRASHWIGVSPQIQAIRIKGIVMSRYQTDGRVKYFRFTHSQEYRLRVHELIKDVEARINGQGHHDNLLYSITCVEACLENCDILYSLEEHSEGRLSVEQCLFCMQFVADPSFSYVDGNTRLLYDFVENRPFLIALLKYVYILSNTACYITALALAKVLLKLDPDDPLCVLNIIDTLAIRAREFKWLVRLVEAWRGPPRHANRLFNMRYSRALALFHIARRTNESEAEASAALNKAIICYPSVIMKIIDFANISVPDDIKNHVLFNPPAKYPLPNREIQQLMNFYAWLIAPRWREPSIMQWLLRVLRDTTIQYDISSDLRDKAFESARLVMQVYRIFPAQLNRHLSVIRSMSSYMGDGNMPSLIPTVAFNPYPDKGLAVDTYDYFTNISQEDEQPQRNAIRSFIEGFAPNFDRFGIEELTASLRYSLSSELIYSDDRYEVHILHATCMSRSEVAQRNAVRRGRGPPPQIFEVEEVERFIEEIDNYLTAVLFSDDDMLPMLITKVIVFYLIVGMQLMYNIEAGEYILDMRNALEYNGFIEPPLD